MSFTPSSSLSLREVAEVFRLLLAMRLMNAAAVIAWADERIMALSNPPLWLIDLSLAANETAHQIERRLADLEGPGNLRMAAFEALSQFKAIYREGQLDPIDAATMLYVWGGTVKIGEAEEISARTPKWIADDVADGIYGTSDTVAQAVDVAIARLKAS
jgi:hypothetical protein